MHTKLVGLTSLLVFIALPFVVHAQDPSSICCQGLAQPSPGTIELPLVSKFPLDVQQVCPAGTAVRAISFSHNNGENFTYQESFGLQCASSKSVVTNACQWGPMISNKPLSTVASAPADSVIIGVRFTHKEDENLTYQQNYAIRMCKLAHPTSRSFKNGQPGGGTTKWHLQSNASCSQRYGGQISGLMISLGFSHSYDLNETYQESVRTGCSFD